MNLRSTILALFWAESFFVLWVDWLNWRAFGETLPPEIASAYDAEKHAKARAYFRANLVHAKLKKFTGLLAFSAFWILGGYEWIDAKVRALYAAEGLRGEIWHGLLFIGALGLLKFVLLQLPFSIHETFGIENRFGFNRTKPATFVADLFRGLFLALLLGAPLLAALIAFFEAFGERGWVYAWAFVMAFNLLISFVAPVWLMPLFNKFVPVAAGPLREGVESYARDQNFPLKEIFTMDSSKRSSKTNAFFAGFGKFRRLVLFDTLAEKHTVPEILAIVAHEVGHFKRKHIPKTLTLSIASSVILFYFLGLAMKSPALFEAFGVSRISTYASLVFVSLLYSPVLRLMSLFPNFVSRRFEFEADEFSRETYRHPKELAQALIRLSADNLSHPTPHWLKVFMDYTHPPVIERVKALQRCGLTTRSARGP